MSAPIQVGTPTEFMAGATVVWKIRLPYYPPDTWTTTYTFVREGDSTDRQQIECTDNGDGYHLATISATASADFAPTSGPFAEYRWFATTTDGESVVKVGDGHIRVSPNVLAATDGYDARTHAERMRDAYEPIMTGTATREEIARDEGDGSIQFKTDEEIHKEYFRFKRIAEREVRDNRRGKQFGKGRKTFFRRVC